MEIILKIGITIGGLALIGFILYTIKNDIKYETEYKTKVFLMSALILILVIVISMTLLILFW